MVFEQMIQDEKPVCIELAARAFAEYEYFAIYIPNSKRRMRFLRSMLQTEFQINADREFFFTAKEDDAIVAAAILCPPGFRKPSDKEYLLNGFWKTVIHGGFRNVGAWNEMENEAISPCKAQKEAWYLSMLVVDPTKAGSGIGSKMIQDCIKSFVAEKGGKALCLFTNSEINRKFYQKNGFEEFDSRQFSYNGKTIGSWSYRMEF